MFAILFSVADFSCFFILLNYFVLYLSWGFCVFPSRAAGLLGTRVWLASCGGGVSHGWRSCAVCTGLCVCTNKN